MPTNVSRASLGLDHIIHTVNAVLVPVKPFASLLRKFCAPLLVIQIIIGHVDSVDLRSRYLDKLKRSNLSVEISKFEAVSQAPRRAAELTEIALLQHRLWKPD